MFPAAPGTGLRATKSSSSPTEGTRVRESTGSNTWKAYSIWGYFPARKHSGRNPASSPAHTCLLNLPGNTLLGATWKWPVAEARSAAACPHPRPRGHRRLGLGVSGPSPVCPHQPGGSPGSFGSQPKRALWKEGAPGSSQSRDLTALCPPCPQQPRGRPHLVNTERVHE